MRDLGDSIIYADPSLYYGEYGDSLRTVQHPEYGNAESGGGNQDVDEFEVVNGPE